MVAAEGIEPAPGFNGREDAALRRENPQQTAPLGMHAYTRPPAPRHGMQVLVLEHPRVRQSPLAASSSLPASLAPSHSPGWSTLTRAAAAEQALP
jgi:hypothetical protein